MIKSSKFHAFSTADEVCEGLDLKDLSIVITGGGSGIGMETSKAFAKAGAAHVYIAVRDSEQGKKAVEEIKAITMGKSNVSWLLLDLADVSSIRKFANDFGSTPINILINNAAVMACPLSYTKDGFELQIGTNHFGHFYLTYLLIPNLQAGAKKLGRPSRVVSLSSIGHRLSPVDFNDLHWKIREYNKWQSYGQAKTANALFAVALDQKLKNTGIRAFAVHPGGIMTPLQRHLNMEEMRAMGWFDEEGKPVKGFKTPEQGASTSVWAAVSPELEGVGGIYLENCSQAPSFSKDLPKMTGVFPHATNPELAEKLWNVSIETLKLAQL